MTDTAALCDIGFVGAGVMGKNLILNLADNGYRVAAFDLDHQKLEAVLAQDKAERGDKPPRVIACSSYTELLSRLSAPHLIVLSVPAGKPVENAQCAGARANLQILASSKGPVQQDTDGDGKPDTVLDDSGRENQRNLAEAAVKAYCPPAGT